MVRNISLLFVIILLITSCFPTFLFYKTTKYGQVRVSLNKFSFSPLEYDESFKYIDTASFYKTTMDSTSNSDIYYKSINSGVKFYGRGRVGFFGNVNFNEVESFDPRKATMGIYKINKNKIEMEFFSVSPARGANIFKDTGEISPNKDTLKLYFTGSLSESRTYKECVKQEIPKEFLIYKPDW